MVDNTTQVVGTIPDTKAYSKTRRDERFILTEQSNIELDSQDSYIVLDSMEAGTLQSIKITTDNPYVQVFLQIDEFRNKDPDGQCAAEIIYNGNSDNPNRTFKVLDGMSSSKGYTLEYKPDLPEEYVKRIRIVIKNSIKVSRSVYGLGMNYTSAGSLPTPAVPAHMAGGTFSHPALETLPLAQISKAMTKPVGVEGYSSHNVYNASAIVNDTIELGSDHPYEGIAGKPTFVRDTSSLSFMEVGTISTFVASPKFASAGKAAYTAQIIDEPEAFPGTTSSPSQMKVRFTPFTEEYVGCAGATEPAGFLVTPWWTRSTIRRTDLMAAGPFGDTWPGTSTYTPFTGGTALDGTVVPASESIIGKRMFLRRGGTIYFPGVVKSVTKSIAPMGLFNIDDVDEVQGFGREIDPDSAHVVGAAHLSTPTNFFPVGVHELSTAGVDNVVIMPFLNAAARDTDNLEGVVIGSTENKAFTTEDGPTTFQQAEVTLTNGGANNRLDSISNSNGTYNVILIPHTPWQYTFTFEPGTKETPIDYPLLYENEADRDLGAVGLNTCLADLAVTSTGQFAGDTDLGKGLLPASEINCWGTVTSQADENPKVLIKSIEVKRNKRVSYEG